MATFQISKLLNKNFSKWRNSTFDNVSHPYNWTGTDGFGIAGFEVTLVSGLSILQSDGNELYSHVCQIYNDATHTYTLSVDVQYDNAVAISGIMYVREFNESNTSTGNYLWETPLTSSFVTNTLTIGGVDSGATLILDNSTTFVQITFFGTNTANYLWSCSRCELLGDSITLDKGFILPVESNEVLIQKRGISASGDVTATDSYGVPLKKFKLNIERMLKSDYNRLFSFLENFDIGVNQYPFNFIFNNNTYFGKFIEPRMILNSAGYYQINTKFTFMENPY